MKTALACHEPPRYERMPRGSAVDGVEPPIRAPLAEFPEVPTSVVMERVGWTRGRSVFYERVAQLWPLFKPVVVNGYTPRICLCLSINFAANVIVGDSRIHHHPS